MACNEELYLGGSYFRFNYSGRLMENEWYSEDEKYYFYKTNGYMAKDELVIINGEIIATGEILLEPIISTVMKRGFRSSVNATKIVLSKLGNISYLKGAIVLATQHIFEEPECITKVM